MTPAPHSVVEGSRDRVLALLRAAEHPLGVAAIQTATGLSANAARFHLDRLVRSGAARAARDPNHAGPGRPAVLFSASPAAAVEPAAAYRLLAGILAKELDSSGRPGAHLEAGRTWARTTGRCAGEAGTDPVAAAMTLFTDTGFQPALRADGRTVELHRCPYLDLAVERPAVVCGVHLGMVLGVLHEIGDGTRVRLVPVLHGDDPCLVRFEDPEDPENPEVEERVS